MAESGSSSTCHCEGVCECGSGGLYGEGGEGGGSFRSSASISWQHFPPSTSSRSRCDDSSMEPAPVKSLPESSCEPEAAEEEKTSSAVSSTEYPITKSISQMNAEHYLKIRHIFELFNFLIGHLVCAEPEDPIEYLKEILERCLRYRDCYGEEPLLVTKYHIKSLYDTFDPYGRGSITLDQYEVAMDNIGISKGMTSYIRNPPLNDTGKISEEFFLNEAYRCLRENLDKMIRVPKDWEENRVLWTRIKLLKQKRDFSDGYCTISGEEDICSESGSVAGSSVSYTTLRNQSIKIRHEPEQLFLSS